ncbi:MAG: hypothetical protein GQ529_02630 [Methyloprofundus sp.]|nr:hypothetical protein [Methyloprofundus sp.]
MIDKLGKSRQLLLNAFIRPKSLAQLELHEWDLLIRCARSSKLLAALGEKIALNCPGMPLPQKVSEQFQAEQQLVEYRKQLVMWELNRLNKALSELDVDIVVLKGGAYILLGIPMSTGRLLADIDILVNKKDIERVEKHLLAQGWRQQAKLDDYDQHYYRTWMHEIPPLRHRDRFVEVDIHHAILPLTSRLHPDSERLLNDAVNVESTVCKVLSPCDMVLHSTVHLFYDAELNGGDCRDLVDLHELLSYYSRQDAGFWDKLKNRADELGLQMPLYYTLYFSSRLLNTKVPEYLLTNNKGRFAYIGRVLMAYLVPLALLPEHPDYPERKVAFARWLLYVRAHYLRMPLSLLIPHLFKKGKKRVELVSN